MLPGEPDIYFSDGELHVEGVSSTTLARRYGTPLYVYSTAAMARALESYRSAFRGHNHLVCYAMKANSTLAVVQWFAARGCGFDIVSVGELERVLAAGGNPHQVVFSGVGKTAAEMERALDVGILCFNVESEGELQTLSLMACRSGRIARVSLRVNPDIDPKTHPYISTGLRSNKFGLQHDRALDAFASAAAMPGIEVVGLAYHIGSQVTTVEPFLDALEKMLDLAEAVEKRGVPLGHLDLGGGLGIAYEDETPPAARDLVSKIIARINARGHGHRKVLMAPGRSLVGSAGLLLAEVLYMKPGAERNFCIVDAAMNDLARPSMYGAWMRVVECVVNGGVPTPVDVVGPICESGDWLARDRILALAAGDLIAVLSCGAYGMSMASNYNSRGRAAEVLVSGARDWLIRDREKPSDLFRSEHLISSTDRASTFTSESARQSRHGPFRPDENGAVPGQGR